MSERDGSDPLNLGGWITPREAAEIIGVTPHHVRYLARQGLVEAQKFGYAWMIKRASAKAYAAQEHRPGPDPKHPPEAN